jgi:hypothetical protein
MSLSTYSDLTAAIDAWLGHNLFDSQASTFVELFESTANRRLLTRQMEATTILVPSNPAHIAVSNAAASPVANGQGGNLIRLAVASTSLLTSGTEIEVAGVNGTSEANGSWIVTVIDGTHIDLQNSAYANSYVGGGTVETLPGTCSLPSDYLAWRRVTWTGQTRLELAYVVPDYFEAVYPTQPADTPPRACSRRCRMRRIPKSSWKARPTVSAISSTRPGAMRRPARTITSQFSYRGTGRRNIGGPP